MRLMLEGSDSVLLIWFCVFMQLGCMTRHQMFRDSLRVKGRANPTFSPVIYCGAKYAAKGWVRGFYSKKRGPKAPLIQRKRDLEAELEAQLITTGVARLGQLAEVFVDVAVPIDQLGLIGIHIVLVGDVERLSDDLQFKVTPKTEDL